MCDPSDEEEEEEEEEDDGDGDGGFLAEELDKAMEQGLDKLLKTAEVIFCLRRRDCDWGARV